jgi:hypothetical protein
MMGSRRVGRCLACGGVDGRKDEDFADIYLEYCSVVSLAVTDFVACA